MLIDAMMQMVAVAGALLLGADPIEKPRLCTEDYRPSLEEAKDTFFWLYLRAPKVDVVQERHRISKRGRKARWRTTRHIEPYGWKDPAAAERMHMPLKDYVFDKALPEFTLQLYCTVAAAEAEGHNVVISSVFRDDWRQSIATGHKASTTKSYHGGSGRGGVGRAADLTVKGSDDAKEAFWKWIDANGPARFKIGRPYGRRDPPHVGPTEGPEYLAHHGDPTVRVAAKKRHRMAHHRHHKNKKIRLARR